MGHRKESHDSRASPEGDALAGGITKNLSKGLERVSRSVSCGARWPFATSEWVMTKKATRLLRGAEKVNYGTGFVHNYRAVLAMKDPHFNQEMDWQHKSCLREDSAGSGPSRILA